MSALVAILEDDAGRIAEMRNCLTEALPAAETVFFDNSYDMIAWLEEHLGEVILISLDHDLPIRTPEGTSIDCGDGRMVADFLAPLSPSSPVIVHSSNDHCAPGMFFTLRDAGWRVARIVPYEFHGWIKTAWTEQIEKYVRQGWIVLPPAP